jgi:hypothetical protein
MSGRVIPDDDDGNNNYYTYRLIDVLSRANRSER